MNLSVGIVGLPNVGKSTLFNALLKKQAADVASYPFCTIEPNVGIIEVPDERLPVLAAIAGTEKIVPAVVEFYDIAGLVKGASQGEGLGNKFLAHIREVALIIHVIRLFEDENVAHVTQKINPKDDIQIIETELMLADLATLEKQKELKGKVTKEEQSFYDTVQLLKNHLAKGLAAHSLTFSPEQKAAIAQLNLLTLKPVINVFNISEQQLEHFPETEKRINEISESVSGNAPYLSFCAKMENEIVSLSPEEQVEYLAQYHLQETGLNRLIKKAYATLNLISYLTTGVKEVRAWTVTKGTLAPQAAGVIHSDFETHFIRADVVPYEIFVKAGGWINAREQGRVQTVGRDYEMKDGDVVEFKVGV